MRFTSSLAALVLLALSGAESVRATPAAISWDAPRLVATGGGERGPWRQNDSRYDYVDDPTVGLDARGAAAVAWVDQRAKDVLLQVFEPEGKARLAAAVNVSRNPDTFSWLPRVAWSTREPEHLFVLWQEIIFSGGSHGGDIFFARSQDGGKTFAAARNLSDSIGGDGKGRINRDIWHNGSLDLAVAPDGTLYAAWTEYDGPLWLARSDDHGSTFSQPARIAGGGEGKPARGPALAASRDGALYLAWTTGEDDAADIHVARSVDKGRTFTKPVLVERTPSYSDAPKIAVDASGTLHVAYAESAAGPFDRHDIRYARSRDMGRTFERARVVSDPPARGIESATFPALALGSQGQVVVLWELHPHSRSRSYGLAIAHSHDGGDSFSPPAVVPGSRDPAGGFNGSQQGLLMRKLDANSSGSLAVVNSGFKPGAASRVWLMRGAFSR